jgi:membrane protein CcdC involved in cytochrome C biogenesis
MNYKRSHSLLLLYYLLIIRSTKYNQKILKLWIQEEKNMMLLSDFLFLLIAGLVSLYPINKIVKYRDRKKGEIKK